jgi:enoyl-CoA hydratase/carnithine racemase
VAEPVGAGPARIPVSTYRLQLTPGFGFAAAAEQADYLAALGVTHAYLSPILQANPGSAHGYDVVDHSRVSADLGGEEAFRLGLADRLAESGQARTQAHELAAQIAAAAPLAVRSIRATMRARLADQARAAMSRERAEQDRLMQTSDWQEGVAAVSQRRPARFTAS